MTKKVSELLLARLPVNLNMEHNSVVNQHHLSSTNFKPFVLSLTSVTFCSQPGISPRTPTTNATKLVEKETISGGSPGSVLSPALNAGKTIWEIENHSKKLLKKMI